MYHIDVVADNTDIVGTLCKTADGHLLSAVAGAVHLVGRHSAAVHVDNGDSYRSVGTADADSGGHEQRKE